jgi:hypothetical protein
LRTLHIVAVVGVACVVGSGCGIGPWALRSERAGYNVAVQASASEQMLLNLVRLKYREPTLFLEVSSISTHVEATAEGDLVSEAVRHGATTVTRQLTGVYSDQPTISYTPLQGEAYATRIITEISVGRLAPLYATGWRVDRLMRMLVERAGELRNDPTLVPAPGETLRPHEKLREIARIWRKLQKNGDLLFVTPTKQVVVTSGIRPEQVANQGFVAAEKEGYHFVPAKDGTWELRRSVSSGLVVRAAYTDAKDADAVDGYLKIKPARTPDGNGRFVERIRLIAFSDVSDGGATAEIAEVPVQIRSLNGILFYLGQGVEVPAAHERRKLVKVYKDEKGEAVNCHEETKDMLEIRCSPTRPADACVAVRYRGHWFYLDDANTDSKDTFSLLLILFALQSGDVKSAQPLLTIPIGGR